MLESDWIDISVPICDAMVHWPGDPPVRIQRVQDIERGDSHTLSAMSIGSHTGTHVDAPAHFIRGGETIDRMALNVFVGKARVLEIKDEESIKVAELLQYKIRRGERILFKTGNSSLWKSDKFSEDFIFLSPEAAQFLADQGIKLVGVDYLSVGGYRGGGGIQHKVLLAAGVCVIEGLNLSEVAPGAYHLVCLPLRLENGDGAPARVIIKPYRNTLS
jgi:arylformamidase